MKTLISALVVCSCLGVSPLMASETNAPISPESVAAAPVVAQNTLQKGVEYLLTRQSEDGSWCKDPAVTALCTLALFQADVKENKNRVIDAYEKGVQYCLKFQAADGSFSNHGRYVNYTTAVVMTTLAAMNRDEFTPALLKARHYLLDEQLVEANPKTPTDSTSPYYGGFGYGGGMGKGPKPGADTKGPASGKGPRGPMGADMSCTALVLEALAVTEHLEGEDNPEAVQWQKKSKLAWGNALKFMEKCQSLPDSADATWIVSQKDSNFDGGFAYRPIDNSNPNAPQGKTLRTYGSMTYAGVKSMIYAKLSRDDFRFKAARAWIAKNYSLSENPGMGQEGLYYYYHTFAKTNSVLNESEIVLENGAKVDWKKELQRSIQKTMREDGSWKNTNGRWMESVPELVTAYNLLALELTMPKK